MSDVLERDNPESNPADQGMKGFWSRHKGRIGLGILALYVFLLGLGTVGELWEIEWILDLPLFRPPGKF